MSWKKVKLKEVLKQYRVQHIVQDHIEYKQVTISKYDGVIIRGTKIGKDIGRKRQFIIDLKKYPNTLMFVRQGVQDGSIGIAPIEVNGYIATENMPMFSVEGIDLEYLRFLLKSPYFHDQLKKIETTGSAQKSIHERQILEIEIPLPDIKQQREFVIQLTKLKNDAGEISNELVHQLKLIKELRQAFLREAMQGKLVKSTNTTKTGQQLLAQIKAEKAKLVAEKKLKKEKELPSITEDEIPFEIPEHWAWCRLGEICTKIGSGSTPKGSNYSEFGKPFFRSQNVHDKGLIYDDIKFISDEVQKQMSGTIVLSNDILLNITGGSLGRSALVPNNFKEGNVSQHVSIIRPLTSNNIFIHNLILSPYFQKLIFSSTTGAGREGLPKYNLEQFIIPLPPVNEQKQIVKKLEELILFCDNLEKSVKESQDYNDMLLQQVLREALQPQESLKTISIENRKIENPLKTILAGHIINLNNTTDFGRVKFQKLLFLTEYICKIDFDSNYIKKVAGPYDDVLIKSIESDFNRMRFFNVVQDKTDNKRVRYTALAGAKELESLFLENFADESLRINNTLLKFRPLSWGECELIATLYAVWNNRIIKNEPITDELLYSDFMAWDKKKNKYHSVFHKWLFWMKDEKIIPDGWGKYIDKPK
ncbi:restriction endonuclease subunit S [Flavobacterium sp. MR2016-29]|uniref:restriction endonuclease subunit S n=1 Tax=Flavobacterium sp. MR2016-29 TaxID=2783795 RepID=UPI00188C0EDD|nr:restriction endonuclease subunit S [Flavobacterium sp. MR2016-29]MBF4491255.1 restriction endonuclease subunit S [Flavobacterium sp. MR2016-29]